MSMRISRAYPPVLYIGRRRFLNRTKIIFMYSRFFSRIRAQGVGRAAKRGPDALGRETADVCKRDGGHEVRVTTVVAWMNVIV